MNKASAILKYNGTISKNSTMFYKKKKGNEKKRNKKKQNKKWFDHTEMLIRVVQEEYIWNKQGKLENSPRPNCQLVLGGHKC